MAMSLRRTTQGGHRQFMSWAPSPATQRIVLRGSVPKLKSGLLVNGSVLSPEGFKNSHVGVEYLGLNVTVHLVFGIGGGRVFFFLFEILPSFQPWKFLIESLSE